MPAARYEPGATSAPWMFGIANSAGGVLAGRIALGELISIYGLNLGPAAPVSSTSNSSGFLPTTLGDVAITIHGTPAPGVFLRPNGGGEAAINLDGSINSPSNPAPDGGLVAIWAIGTGYFPGSDGQIAAPANVFCTTQLLLCGIPSVAGTSVRVTYSGAAPDDVNGVQINFEVSAAASFGYYLSVNGFNSNSFIVYTTPGLVRIEIHLFE